MMSVSVISLYTCSLSSAFALPLCTHNPEPLLLRLNLRLLLCVNAGNPVKSITIIVVPKAPWRPEDAVHHSTASIFQLNLFFFFFFYSLSTPKGQFQSRGYGSVEMLSIASCSFVSVVASLFDLAVSLSVVWTSSLTSQ